MITVNFLENEIPLNSTSTGLYHLPLTPAKQMLKKVNSNNERDLIPRTTENKFNREIALKIHYSFAHSSPENF